MIDYMECAPRLVSNGYLPLPIKPRDKAPAVGHWRERAGTIPAEQYPGYGVGIACGRGDYPIAAIDIDLVDPDLVRDFGGCLGDLPTTAPLRIGQYPKSLFVVRTEPGVRKMRTDVYEEGHVEILADGQQFVGYGIHPGTSAPYSWASGGDPLTRPAWELPYMDRSGLQAILDAFGRFAAAQGLKMREKARREMPEGAIVYDPDDPMTAKRPLGTPIEELSALLGSISPDCSREQWIRAGMAVHHETEGSSGGYALWDQWSAGSNKYVPGETESQWRSFARRYTGEPVTAASLKLYASEAIRERQAEKTAALTAAGASFFEALPRSIDRFRGEPQKIPMVIEGMLPADIVSMLYSGGGVGKSTLALNVAARIALARVYPDMTIYGHRASGGTVVIVTAEDPDVILHHRIDGLLKGLADELGIDTYQVRDALRDRLYIISTYGYTVGLFNVLNQTLLQATPYYESLARALEAIPNLVQTIIDTKTRYSPAEGTGNVLATQEITHYEALAKRSGAGIMLLHHTNKASRNGSVGAGQAFRDASAIYDSVRAAWYLRPPTDDELARYTICDPRDFTVLENAKNNYVKCGDSKLLERRGYCYRYVGDARPVSAEEKKEIAGESARRAILTIVQASPACSRSTIIERVKNLGVGTRQAERSLKQCETLGLLTVNKDGPAGTAHAYTVTPAAPAVLEA